MHKKKKILIGYIQNGHAGGVDKYILNLIASVSKELYEITLLSNQKDSELCEKLAKENITLHEVPTLKHPFRQYISIKKLIEENKYDVVYLNISTAIHCLALIAAKKCKVRNRIVHSHSSDVNVENKFKRCVMRGIHGFCKIILSHCGNIYIGCSQKAGEWMFTPNVIASDKYFVIHNSVKLDKFIYDESMRNQLRKEMGWDNKKVLIHVANFTYQKNNEFIIEVFKKVKEKQPNTTLVLIGKGEKEELIRALIGRYDLESDVLFLKDILNVNEYLQAADLFLLPSRFEGYPISALEAQINGLPCLLSDKITKESKIVDECAFLPLKIEKWVENILNVSGRTFNNYLIDMEEFDNNSLSASIEALWSKI